MNRIKELRQNLGLTQTELGAKVGLNQTAIGKYEREQLDPSIDTLKKFCSIFQCSIDYIIGFSDDLGVISIQDQKTVPLFSPEEQRLIEDYRELAPALRELLQATIRTWKNPDANTNVRKKLK